MKDLRLVLETSIFFRTHEVSRFPLLSWYNSLHVLMLVWVCTSPFKHLFLSAGGGQLPTICAWQYREDRSMDDWFWEDCPPAAASHPGPPHPLGRGQPRGRVPVGAGQPHRCPDWHTASPDLNLNLTDTGPHQNQNILSHLNHTLSEWPRHLSP